MEGCEPQNGTFSPCPLFGRLFLDKVGQHTWELVDTTTLQRVQFTAERAELVYSPDGMQEWICVLERCVSKCTDACSVPR